MLVSLFGACDDRNRIACESCELVLDTILSLVSEERAPLLLDTDVLRSSTGEWFAAPVAERGQIAVFDSTGRYLRSIGRAGNGPGEFGEIRSLTNIGPDTIGVIHHANGRGFDLLDAAGHYVRRPRLPVDATPGSIFAIHPGRWLISPPQLVYPDGRRNGRLFLLANDSLQELVPARDGDPYSFKLTDAGNGRIFALETSKADVRFLDTLGSELSKYPFRLPTEENHYEFHLGQIAVRNDTLFTMVWRWMGKPADETAPDEVAVAGRPDLDLILKANEYFLDVRHASNGARIAFIPLQFLSGFVDKNLMIVRGQDSAAVYAHIARFAIKAR